MPADVSSHAFNREVLWADTKQQEIAIEAAALPELKMILDGIISTFKEQFSSGFIAESPQKLEKIYQHYAAFNGLAGYPFKKCNAPWVSTVVEADGTVRPCFFHEGYGNIHNAPAAASVQRRTVYQLGHKAALWPIVLGRSGESRSVKKVFCSLIYLRLLLNFSPRF